MTDLAWPPARPTLLSGWGRTAPTGADVLRPHTEADAKAVVTRRDPRGVVARGLARSYGDAAQNAGGSVLDATGLDRILAVDAESGVVVCEGGVSLDALMRQLLPLGWFVPVTPGTRFVTIGGAIAADIHGKNHHRSGSFAQHVRSIDLLGADGEVRTLTPEGDPDLFWATAGGMGLTGVILRAAVQMLRVTSSWMLVDTERARDLDDLMQRLSDGDHRYRYSVAWIDCLARGARMGRGVLTRANHAPAEAVDANRGDPLAFDAAIRLRAPAWVPSGLLRHATVAAFNEVWFRKAPRHREGQLQRLAAYFHPLDMVADWNRIYGSSGVLQYQFAVPFGHEDVVRTAVERLSATGAPSFLAVLKRFADGDPGLLSFPRRGWTLALDVSTAIDGLGPLLDELDELVAQADGAIYLAKDARLRPELLGAMYPRLAEWRDLRARIDPHGAFSSDLSRRLHL